MNMRKISAVYFSPTGTTKKVVTSIASKLAEDYREIDITRPKAREKMLDFNSGDLVIVGVPTYAGKVPNKLLPYLKAGLNSNGALAVPIVTYGNRNFDNSLAELASILIEEGFSVVGAGAFVCRHAFSDELAYGRPREEDMDDIDRLVQGVTCKLESDDISLPEIPGDADAPYYIPKGVDGQPVQFLKAKPKVDLGKCSGCGACVRLCPMGSISADDVSQVPGPCIKCQACIRRCMRAARYFDDEAFLSHVRMLEENYAENNGKNVIII